MLSEVGGYAFGIKQMIDYNKYTPDLPHRVETQGSQSSTGGPSDPELGLESCT